MPQVSDEGYDATLNNTIEAPFGKFEVEGHSEQETTEGRNLLEITENNTLVHCSYVSGANTNEYKLLCTASDMYVNEIRSAGSSYGNVNGNLIPCKYGETIYFDIGNSLFSKNYFNEFDENLISLGSYNRQMSSGTYTPTNSNCKYVTLRFGYGSNAQVGTTYTLAPIVSKTSDLTYESYTNGASPNPSYEQPIKSCGENGSITEKIINKNWFDKVNTNWYRNNSSDFENTANGLTDRIRTNSFRILGGKTYIISGLPAGITLNNVRAYDINKTRLDTPTKSGNSFTLNSNVSYIHILCNGTGMTDATNILMKNADIQIELGITESTYIAHEEQTYTIPTQQPMRSIGDIRDDFVKQDGVWYERHYIGRKVFDGTETFIGPYNAVGNTRKFHIDYTTGEQDKGLCNYFTKGLYSNRAIDGVEHFYIGTTTLQFRVSTTIATTTTELKTWVAGLYANGTPLYVNYLLAEPTLLPCTQSQIDILESIPKTSAGQTNVYSIDEVKTYLKVAGLLDLNTLVNN